MSAHFSIPSFMKMHSLASMLFPSSASFAIGKEMLNFDTFRLFSSSTSRPVSHLSRI